MLACPLKESKPLDWSGPLRTYLKNNYSAEELDKHSSSIQRLSTTREQISNVSGAASSSVDALESYLIMLGQIEPRFPLGEQGLKMSFVWYDALKPTKKLSYSELPFERACVLFNLGAVLSHQGMVQDRSDASCLKKACQFFQRAAGIFIHIKDNMLGNELNGPTTSDLSPDGLEMLSSLMLAQAQACFYEKAIKDNLSIGILSKLSAQACAFYRRAYECSQSPILSATLDPAWAAHLEFQHRCFAASSQYQYAKVVHAQAEKTTVGYGEEIARLALASEYCAQAIHHAQIHKLPASMLDTVKYLRSMIEKRLTDASADNNSIYMDTIPNKNDLGEPKGTALAKPIAPGKELTQMQSISGRGGDDPNDSSIFGGLLPVVMQEAEALYQSRLSSMVEASGKNVADACENIKLSLSDAGLPAAVEAGDGSNGLPDAVWERLNNQVLTRGGVDGLKRGVNANAEQARKVETALNEIETKLLEEERADSRARATWGEKWYIRSSAELSMHMRTDINRYKQLIGEARASDQVLKEKLTSSLPKMEILSYSRSKLDSLFPSSEALMNNPEVESKREELALQLVTLGAAVQEVEALQAQLVDNSSNDSIATAMARAPGGAQSIASSEAKTQSLIESEVGKYRTLQREIDSAVENLPMLLSRVLDMNHDYSQMKNTSEESLKREGLIAEIYQAIQVYEEIVTFILEGEKFYTNLYTARIEQLRTTAADHCYVRDMQRKELEAELAAAAASDPAPATTTPSATATTPNNNGNTGAYPGMSRPGLNRMNSQPFMQPYAAGGTAQAFPLDQQAAAAPAYPISNAPPPAASAAPPPSYSAATNGGGSNADSAKLQVMKSTLGNTYSDAQLTEALDGAGGDVNIAINHLLGADPPPSTKRKSKRFGVF